MPRRVYNMNCLWNDISHWWSEMDFQIKKTTPNWRLLKFLRKCLHNNEMSVLTGIIRLNFASFDQAFKRYRYTCYHIGEHVICMLKLTCVLKAETWSSLFIVECMETQSQCTQGCLYRTGKSNVDDDSRNYMEFRGLRSRCIRCLTVYATFVLSACGICTAFVSKRINTYRKPSLL